MSSEDKENHDQVNEMDKNKSDKKDTTKITKREDLTSYFEVRDHSVNQLYQSEVPKICKDEPCLLGIDEAGRGPVLGPMVYGIAYAPINKKQLLVDLGCADSKSLTEEKRDVIFDKICNKSDQMGWAVEAISPNQIANSMYKRTKTSLNQVSMDSAVNLVKKTIEAGVFITEIYVDTVGPAEKYQAKLEILFPGIKITVSKKADSIYPVVSAASICAKVARDHALRAWQFKDAKNEENDESTSNYGSGYPNDPMTKTWLANNVDEIFGFPQLVRFSWSTAEKILESKAITVEWEDPEEDDDAGSNSKIYNFFSPSSTNVVNKETTKNNRHQFFNNRNLSNTVNL